jgi:hypothetical protein
MPSPIPRWTRWGSVARLTPTNGGLPRLTGGSAPTLPVSRPAQRSLALRPARSLSRLARPFFVGVFQRKSLPPLPAPTASGWSDQFAGWDSHPLETAVFARHTVRSRLTLRADDRARPLSRSAKTRRSHRRRRPARPRQPRPQLRGRGPPVGHRDRVRPRLCRHQHVLARVQALDRDVAARVRSPANLGELKRTPPGSAGGRTPRAQESVRAAAEVSGHLSVVGGFPPPPLLGGTSGGGWIRGTC